MGTYDPPSFPLPGSGLAKALGQATNHHSGGECSGVFDYPHNKAILGELHLNILPKLSKNSQIEGNRIAKVYSHLIRQCPHLCKIVHYTWSLLGAFFGPGINLLNPKNAQMKTIIYIITDLLTYEGFILQNPHELSI